MKWKAALLLAAGLLAVLAACAKQEPPVQAEEPAAQAAELTVWGAAEDETLLTEIFDAFERQHAGQVRVHFQAQSESSCKDALLGDLENGPDVFTFADDQVAALAAAGALDPIEDDGAIRSANLSAAVDAASVEGTLYAYPLTADNGYFLYYHRDYFSEEDIRSLNRMVEIAAEEGRKVAMDWSSGWYVYAFFGNTGLEVGLNEDGITNLCTWNATDGPIRGVDVAQAMLDIADSPGFASRTDSEFLEGVRDGSVIAGVSGVWNAVAIEEAWGGAMGAARLPAFTCAGQEVQMASFSGCKLIGVNAYSKQPEWAPQPLTHLGHGGRPGDAQLLDGDGGHAAAQRRRLLRGAGRPGDCGASGAVGVLASATGRRQILGPGDRIRGKYGARQSVRRVASGAAGPHGRGRDRAVTTGGEERS